MGFEPITTLVKRYARTFDVLSPNAFIAPFYFMTTATTGVQGDAVKYVTTNEDTVAIATSGNKNYEIAGFLMQDVKDLDGGQVKGYRNLQNSVVNYGDNVGVWQGDGSVAYTKRYNGSPALGDRLCVNDSTGKLTIFTSLMTGDPIAVVEAITSSDTPTVEPAQTSAAAPPDFIRIRVYNLG